MMKIIQDFKLSESTSKSIKRASKIHNIKPEQFIEYCVHAVLDCGIDPNIKLEPEKLGLISKSDQLRTLSIGDSLTWEDKNTSLAHATARNIGIKVRARTNKSKEIVTITRIK